MHTEHGKDERFPVFGCCALLFFCIVAVDNARQHAVDAVGIHNVAIPIAEDEAGITVNDRLIEALLHLPFPLFQQRLSDRWKHGNLPDTSLCLWRGDVVMTFPIVVLAIDQVVVDGDHVFLEIHVIPSQPCYLPDTSACAQQHSEQRHPMPVHG